MEQTQISKIARIALKKAQRVQYLLHLPSGYKPKGRTRWPLMVFLHGAGERGKNVHLVAKHGPPKMVRSNPDFPFILVSPQCPVNQVWSNDVIVALIEEVCEVHRVDRRRIYLTGLSMGGYGAWSLAAARPEIFAAVAPICGGGSAIEFMLANPSQERAYRSLGVWAFHGARDEIVPLGESERMVEAFCAAGGKARLTIYPEAGHDSWTETYGNPELYEWLLNHRR